MKILSFLIIGVLLLGCQQEKTDGTDENTDKSKDTTKVTTDTEQKTETPALDTTNLSKLRTELGTILADDIKDLTENDRRFMYSEVDVNGDGSNETLVMMQSPYYCGTGGCTLILLNSLYKPITKFSVSDEPVMISSGMSNEWNDIVITSDGAQHVMKYNGNTYPTNPSVAPEFKDGDGEAVQVKFSPVQTF